MNKRMPLQECRQNFCYARFAWDMEGGSDDFSGKELHGRTWLEVYDTTCPARKDLASSWPAFGPADDMVDPDCPPDNDHV